MKTIIKEKIGGDGAEAALVVEAGMLRAQVSYPIAPLVDAVVKPVDKLKEELKKLIPGNWDDPIIDGLFSGAKAELTKLLSE